MQRYRSWRRVARRLASWTHLYFGLVAGLLLSVVGVTGTLLVFHDELDRLLDPHLHIVEAGTSTVPLDQVVAAAAARLPEHTPSFIRLPPRAGSPVEIWTDGESGPAVFVDPNTAAVLGTQAHGDSFTGWLFELHVELFTGEVGHIIVGVSGIVLVVLLVSGLVLWWPKAYRWARALLSAPRGPWRRFNYELHGLSGAWSSLLLLVIAVTGTSLVFHDEFRAGLNALTLSESPPPPPRSVARGEAADASLQEALATAERALPGGAVTWIYLPATPDAPLTLRKRMPGEWHPNGRSYLYFDRHTGELLRADDARAAQLGTRIYDLLYPLHIGRFGLWSKLLYAALGLLPLVLSVGGTLIWWDRRRRSRARRPAPAVAAGEPAANGARRRGRRGRRERARV